MFFKIVVLKNFANFFGNHLWKLQALRTPACNVITKEILADMFFCQFCKIFKNIFWQNTSGWLLLKGTLTQIWKSANIFVFIAAPQDGFVALTYEEYNVEKISQILKVATILDFI